MLQKISLIPVVLVLLILSSGWIVMAQSDCNLPPQLVVGGVAQVTEGQSNNVRESPSRDATRLGVIPSGEIFEVLEGPTCADGLQWWRVHHGNLIGWTVEGSDGEYWIVPIAEQPVEPPLVLSTTVITTENITQLQPIRDLSCDTGPDSSLLVALGSRVVAMSCGFYNMGNANLSSREQSVRDHIGIIDLETGQHLLTLSGEGDDVYPIAFVPDGHLLWFSQESSRSPFVLHLSDITTGEEINRAEIVYGQSATHLFIHPVFYANNTRFALLYVDEGEYILHRWDATTLTLLEEQVFEKPEQVNENSIVAFAIAPDGERFAINYYELLDGRLGDRSELAIYSTDNPQPEVVFNNQLVTSVANADITFSPSGYFIIGSGDLAVQIGGGDPVIYWWNAADGTQVAEWEVPHMNSGRIEFSPDNKLIVVGGDKVYDVSSGELIHTLQHSYWWNAAFSADGTFLVTYGSPLTTIWAVAP